MSDSKYEQQKGSGNLSSSGSRKFWLTSHTSLLMTRIVTAYTCSMRYSLFLLLVIWCGLSTRISYSQTATGSIRLDKKTKFLPIGRQLSVLEDKTARLTFAQVRRRTDFVASQSEAFQYGYSSSAYWFRFQLISHSQENSEHWLIGLLDAITIEYADCYVVYPDGRVDHQTGGLKRPYIDRGFFATAPFFRVSLPTNQPVTVYFRIESSLAIYGKVTVWEEYYNLRKGRTIIFVIWMFLGLFILRSLNSFVLAWLIPNRQFRFYAVCTFLLYLTTLSRTGIYPILLSDHQQLLDWMHTGMGLLMPLGLATWLYSLLDKRPAFRVLRWLLLGVAALSLVGVFLPFVVQNAFLGQLSAMLVFASYVLFFLGAVLTWAIGQRPALLFILPITICIIPFSLFQLQALNVIRFQPIISQLALLALAVEMVSMSLVLGRIVQSYIKERVAAGNALMKEKVEVDKLQELDTLKTQFFTNISHEFRTPLTLILGPLTDLKHRFLTEKVVTLTEPVVTLMEQNSNRLLSLINQLLDLSKLEANQLKAEPQPGDIAVFFRTLASSFSSLAESRQIQFSFTQEYSSFRASFDRDKIEKILTNLLSNAFKFTPGGKAVQLRIDYPASGETGELIINVADTGIGIAPAYLANVFERFYQVDSKANRMYEGTGIGLSLVNELVKVLGGTITVSSTEGVGTSFTVGLPLVRLDQPIRSDISELPKPVERSITSLADLSDTSSPTPVTDNVLLITDDNADIRAYIRSVFESDYHIIEANDGQDGLEKATASLPNVIICDLMMPRLDGLGFCRQLKSQETTSHIPIIMLTAKATVEDRIEGLELGADDYLTKPFNQAELKLRVRNLMQKQAQLQQYYSGKTNVVSEPVHSVKEKAFLQKTRAVVMTHMADSDFSVEHFSQIMNMSQSQLVRKLKALTGQTAVEYIRSVRLEQAAERLRQGISVSEVAYGVGFESLSYFTRVFQEKYGVLPSAYETL